MAKTPAAIVDSLLTCFETSKRHEKPYRHWFLSHVLPMDVTDEITDLPYPAPDVGGMSGKRELHNATRKYFDVENQAKYPTVKAFCDAFQDPRVTGLIARHFGTRLNGTYLRVEFAQDTDGFWLEPHTDLGVKVFTMLVYLSRDAEHGDMGTDIYDNDKKYLGRAPFAPNLGLVFIPGNDTYHGFEPRPIHGVRKSIIINYVTDEWRARDQLSFPSQPIQTA